MAIFTITPLTSVFETSNDPAFDGGSAAADTLIVQEGAFLTGLGSGVGAFLGSPGIWTVAINGSIFSHNSIGLQLAAGIAGISKITVGSAGSIGGADGIFAESAVSLKNSGLIAGSLGAAVQLGVNKDTVTNSGEIAGPVGLGGGNDTLTNSASMTGGVNTGDGDDLITNSGFMSGTIQLQTGNNRVVNSGDIGGTIFGDVDNDTILNTGLLSGADINLGEGLNTLTNSGRVFGNITCGANKDTIVNKGSIGADTIVLNLGGGDNKLTNSGTIASDITAGSANDTLINKKSITGSVTLGHGDNTIINTGTMKVFNGGLGPDTFTNFAKIGKKTVAGTVFQALDLGGGADVYNGGKNLDGVRDNLGDDIIKLGGGNDLYIAISDISGNDIVSGGSGGGDILRIAGNDKFIINLDTIAHDRDPFNPGVDLIDGGKALNTVNPLSLDSISGFENVEGGGGDDTVYGSAVVNVLEGAAGNDQLFGYGSNDTLMGGTGSDGLTGGAGRDVLWGNQPGFGDDGVLDFFSFISLGDSGVTKATRDVIMDFEDGLDIIHIFHIDANTTNAPNTNDDFVFGGVDQAFSGTAGDLRVRAIAAGWIVAGDVDGDSKADFSIEVRDSDHSIVWTSADFFGLI
jgi:Ca2+-binding RTX toxin-like protein